MKAALRFGLISLALGLGPSLVFGQMTVVNGASFASAQPMAPGSFASIFGQNLCAHTQVGDWIHPGNCQPALAIARSA